MSVGFDPIVYDDIDPERRPSLGEALVPIVGMIAALVIGIVIYGLGNPQIPLLWGIVVAGLFGRYYLGYSWDELYAGISRSILMGLQAILILFVVYMLIASWVSAGTIPTLMYYGLEFLNPMIFLPFATILSAIVAFAVGSSWTTAGTLGIAMVGIGEGLGVSAAMTAGAVLSGAYTGDKNSPLSDTTNLAAAVTNTELMDHVRAMRVGTLLAFGISVLLFAIIGLTATGTIPADRVAEIQGALTGSYEITLLALLPLVVTFALALYGYPALPSLGAGVFAAVAVSMLLQGTDFVTVWSHVYGGTGPETGLDITNSLLATGGLAGSVWVITIVFAALALGGILEASGILAAIAYYIGKAVSSVFGVTAGTAASAISMNILAAEQYVAIVVPGMTLRDLYDQYDLDSRNLSRAVEASGTTTSALVPWNSGGAYMAGVFGISTWSYAPFYFFGFLSPLILLVMGYTGWQIVYQDETATEETGNIPDPTATTAGNND